VLNRTADTLHADLTSVGYKYLSDGRLLLEAKEDMKKRSMPSPDEADAVALCFLDARWLRHSRTQTASIPKSNTLRAPMPEAKQVIAIVSKPV